MDYMNDTFAHRFILIGLSINPHLQTLLFVIFLVMYVLTILGNVLIIVLVRIDTRLQSPMYFFLSNLSFIDLCFSTTILPKLLMNTLAKDKSISFLGCAAQMYCHFFLGGTECIILSIMAFDRFVAICYPLRYNTIMNKRVCVCMVIGSWYVNFINSIFHAFLTFQLPYCRSNHVDHYFCEMPPLLRLSCKDTLLNEIAVYVSGGLVGLCPFLLTVMSYVQIISTILKIRSSKGSHKAFSTCSSHLTVVCLYYGAIVFMYLRPQKSYLPEKDRAVSIIYTVVAPMVNPIIYSIRNNEVKGSLRRMLTMKTLIRL